MTEANHTNDVAQDTTTDLDKDTIHSLLSNSRRRAVLRILSEEGRVEKSHLSSLVAADEYSKTVDELDSDERKRVHISLHQVHLKKLKEVDVIDVNGEISLTKNAEDLIWHLEAEPGKDMREKLRASIKDLF